MSRTREFLDKLHPHFARGGRFEKYYSLYEMVDTFIYSPSDVTKGTTHVRDGIDLKRTMTYVVLALCLVCAILVSVSAVALKSMQQDNKSLDMRRNILGVAGLLDDGASINEAFEQVETRVVDLETGDYVDSIDVESYDQRKATKDPELSVKIFPKDDIASIRRKAKYAKVYLVKKDDQLQTIILPVHGYGLWSTMYGLLALADDGQTIVGLNFYDQAETPGLGGEVVNPKWRALWAGKKVYNEQGQPVIGLIKGSVDSSKAGAEYQVDGLAGATLTSQGVTNLLRYWMGKEGFAPFLDRIRSERG